MPKTVFLLTSGEYSDFQVHAAYSERSDADSALALMGNDFDLMEVDLDAHMDRVRAGMRQFIVRRDIHGAFVVSGPMYYSADGRLHNVYARKVGGRTHYMVEVLAENAAKALKGGTERIRQYIAMQGIEHP